MVQDTTRSSVFLKAVKIQWDPWTYLFMVGHSWGLAIRVFPFAFKEIQAILCLLLAQTNSQLLACRSWPRTCLPLSVKQRHGPGKKELQGLTATTWLIILTLNLKIDTFSRTVYAQNNFLKINFRHFYWSSLWINPSVEIGQQCNIEWGLEEMSI